jgi:hypothetical protein
MKHRRLTSSELREVALHEARHAVFGIVHEVPFMFCAIEHGEPDGPLRGIVAGGHAEWVMDAITVNDRDRLTAWIGRALAGYASSGPWMPDLPNGRPAKGNWPPSWIEANTTGDPRDPGHIEHLADRLRITGLTASEYADADLLAREFTTNTACIAAVEAVAAALLADLQRLLLQRQVEEIAAPHLAGLVIRDAQAITAETEEER